MAVLGHNHTAIHPAQRFNRRVCHLPGRLARRHQTAPMMIEGNDKPGFKIDLHIKDLNNVLDCAHAIGAPVPMTAEVQEIFQWLHNHGKGQADHSAIAQYYEKLTGIQIGR